MVTLKESAFGGFAILADGVHVGFCTTEPGAAKMLEILPEHRRKGYALAAVKELHTQGFVKMYAGSDEGSALLRKAGVGVP